MSTFPEITALAVRARAMQAKHDACERSGGHYYQVDGFSRIAHPEVYFGDHPRVNSLSEIVFRAYVCSECGRRVSTEDGREYMRTKPLSAEAEERRRQELLDATVPNWREYYID